MSFFKKTFNKFAKDSNQLANSNASVNQNQISNQQCGSPFQNAWSATYNPYAQSATYNPYAQIGGQQGLANAVNYGMSAQQALQNAWKPKDWMFNGVPMDIVEFSETVYGKDTPEQTAFILKYST